MKTFFTLTVLVALASASVIVNSNYGMRSGANLDRQLNALDTSLEGNTCYATLARVTINEIVSYDKLKDTAGGKLFRVEVFLSSNLDVCFKETNTEKKDHVTNLVGFCSRDNEYKSNLNNGADPLANMLNDTDYFLPFNELKSVKTLVTADDLKTIQQPKDGREFYWQGAAQGKFDNQNDLKNTDGKPKGAYSYRYSFNLPQAEWMSTNPGIETKGYTWAFKEDNLASSGREFDQYAAYFMHTFWKSGAFFARWFEWSFTIKTYTVISTESDNVMVQPVLIPGPPCENCVATIKHSAEMLFFEERDTTQTGFPDQIEPANMKYAADCNWDVVRGDLAFQALNLGVCIGIRLKDKTTKRKFQLERLLYGYKGADGINHPADKFHLYDKVKPNAPPANAAIKYFKWDNVRKLFGIRFDILATGQLERLQYSAQVRLCELEDPYVENQCLVTRAGKYQKEFTDIDFKKMRERMLAGDETAQRQYKRYLANADKQVVAKYQSEHTYVGKSKGLNSIAGQGTKEESGSGAVVGAVIGVGVLGGLGVVAWMFQTKKACFAAK